MARFVVQFTAVIPHSGGEEYRDPIPFDLAVIASDADAAEHEGRDAAYLEARAVPYDPRQHGEWVGEDDWLAEDEGDLEGESQTVKE